MNHDQRKARFLRQYANVPVEKRNNIIIMTSRRDSYSWDDIYFEVQENTMFAKLLLKIFFRDRSD